MRERMALDWNRRLMQQPPGASCKRCGIQAPFVLVLPIHREKGQPVKKRPLLCYKCRTQLLGRSGYEGHHLGGRPSPLREVLIDANMHRILFYAQLVWRNAGIAPGSTEAVALDVRALAVARTQWQVNTK